MRTTLLRSLAAGTLVFAAGAASTYWVLRGGAGTAGGPAAAAPQVGHAAHGASVVATAGQAPAIQLEPGQVGSAGIATELAGGGAPAGALRLPGTVQPNAYTRVVITPLVSGRVTSVPVQLGQHVRRGQTIAELYSPDLADARTRYLSAKAVFEAGALRLQRTERLATLGSASLQEVEGVRAEHAGQDAELQQAAARLRLLRVDPAGAAGAATTTIRIQAPRDGVVIDRPATEGMTAEPSTPLATIAEMSPVWVIADVNERDVARVRIGADAVVTAESYPGLELRGRISYIAPDVRPETRTTQVRIEVRNEDGNLRFGMFVTVRVQDGGAVAVSVPRSAVQSVGNETVVYVADPASPGRFTERTVVLGSGDDQRVTVASGLAAGERVASAGTFALRAETARLGRSVEPAGVAVTVSEHGFDPQTIRLPEGRASRITFTRTTDKTCANDVVVAGSGVRHALPLNEPVTIELTPAGRAPLSFACGMGMWKGTILLLTAGPV